MKRLIALMLISFSCSAFAQELQWIPFQWHSEVLSGRKLDKVAMFVPVTIDNLQHKFVMQFDMGADATMIYGKTIKPWLSKYPSLEEKLDNPGRTFKNVDFKIGDASFGPRDIYHNKNFGARMSKHAPEEESPVLIGTVGTDVLADKILIIDYPNQRICFTSTLPPQYTKATFKQFKTKWGKIIIPLSVGGEDKDLLFDTGSSLFAIATSEDNADKISQKANVDSFSISSWGKEYMVYGRNITAEVRYGTQTLPPALVFYDKKGNMAKMNEPLDVWGITGNTYFLNNVVIIDWNNKQFGVQ